MKNIAIELHFFRICSGKYEKGMKIFHERTGKLMQISKALTFMAGEREQVEDGYAGDIIGLHNHGGIQIGDSFTQGEKLKFKWIPNFAPEIFKRVKLNDPLKMKALQKRFSAVIRRRDYTSFQTFYI